MKYTIALLLLVLAMAGLMVFKDEPSHNDEPLTGLPWQIDILPNGDTRVFGITPGRTTLGGTIELMGRDLDLAIIAAPHEAGTLEAYYSHYSAGPITGKLILVLAVAPDSLLAMRERGYQDGGTRRYHLHPDDLPLAYQAPVRVINFMPSFNLDEDIVQARFGPPASVIQADAQQRHFLYPDKGLDLILDLDGKEVLQYLSPAEFSAHRLQLQQSHPAGE